jgi:alkane 1-monooxygenase
LSKGFAVGAIKFAGPFAFALSIPLLYAAAPEAALIVPAAIPLALLIAEQLPLKFVGDKPSAMFRGLPVLYVPLQLAITAWAAHQASVNPSGAPFAALAISTGACAGVFGVLAAHELVHSRTAWHQALGTAMLYGMTYPHFRIAHIHGHHRHAATERDASTARPGESFYAFLPRTLWQQLACACAFEERRCAARELPLLRNRLVRDAVIITQLYLGIGLLWGWHADALLAAESAIGIVVLELFNYIAHYGLVRRSTGGRPEPFANRHSWNTSGLGNLLIFNMGRHGHHHRKPAISYEGLRAAAGPELPLGYSGSIILALIPPLWRMVMDGRARWWNGDAGEIGYAAASRPVPAAP